MNSARKVVPDLHSDPSRDSQHDQSHDPARDLEPKLGRDGWSNATPEPATSGASFDDHSVPAAAQPAPVASWYAQGMSDGLGDRLLMFDNTAAASLELLRFGSELASAPGFEKALRESVERLAFFKHTVFAQARAVEYLDGDDGLALVSTHTPGKRLSEMFHGRQSRSGMHPAFVTWLIRQLAPALADFHAHGRGIAHGVLTPER